MKKVFVYLFATAAISIASCTGRNTGQTGGAQADSGQTNVGSSGPADSSATSTGSGSATPVGSGGTDTSGNGKGTTNPTSDTLKTTPK